MSENRRSTFLGMSVGNWLSVAFFTLPITLGGAYAYGQQQEKITGLVDDVTSAKQIAAEAKAIHVEDMEKLRTEIKNEVQESEQRVVRQIDKQNESINELRDTARETGRDIKLILRALK